MTRQQLNKINRLKQSIRLQERTLALLEATPQVVYDNNTTIELTKKIIANLNASLQMQQRRATLAVE
jgi:hypothetical protein